MIGSYTLRGAHFGAPLGEQNVEYQVVKRQEVHQKVHLLNRNELCVSSLGVGLQRGEGGFGRGAVGGADDE